MKVTGLYVYPVKSLRGIALTDALLGPQGVRYDRRFMLLSTKRSKEKKLQRMQLSGFPECALFSQELALDGKGEDAVIVRYHPPPPKADKADKADKAEAGGQEERASKGDSSRVVMSPVEHPPLRMPLSPPLDSLRPLNVDLHGSPADGYRMGDPYDAWFSACFGFDVVVAFIGDGRRAVLGETLKPKLTAPPAAPPPVQQPAPPAAHWLARLLSYLVAAWAAILAALGIPPRPSRAQGARDEPWLTFSDCAPFMIASEASLRNVSARMPAGVEVPMYKFRPNIVVDGEDDKEWDEDYWGELTVASGDGDGDAQTPALSRSGSASSSEASQDPVRLLLTSNCARGTSLNVDYTTGATAQGELGQVLKRLSKDRRVDTGIKYSPVFGRYAFLDRHEDDSEVRIAVGDDVTVTQRNSERTVWDWPGL